MKRLMLTLRRLRASDCGSLPLQYAIIASGTTLVALMIMQTASSKVAQKLNAVTATLNKTQF
jgi:hypothetical protein